jgi:hypothetical protein
MFESFDPCFSALDQANSVPSLARSTMKKAPPRLAHGGALGNQRWRSCVAATQAQCRTLGSGREGAAGAAFERKVFT